MFRRIAVLTAVALAIAGCETVQNNPNTAIGAGVGAVAGAALGTLAGGDDRRNALIGAGIGLLAGGAVGHYLDRQQRDLEQDLAGTGAEVTRMPDHLLVNLPAGVTFSTNSASLDPQFYEPLDRMAFTLNEYPQSYIDVLGHTDSTGSEAYNMELSQRRAGSVASYLADRRVFRDRIFTRGFGETQPIASNATPEGRRANRRVEIKIIPAVESTT